MITLIGTGITPFGELWGESLESLLRRATDEALQEAGVSEGVIEAVFVANMGAGVFSGQLHLGPLVSSFFSHHPPAMRIEGACASGSLALVAAEYALLSGQYSTVLVIGGEKMTDVSATQATEVLAGAADVAHEYGSTFPALYALLAQAHSQKYGTTREHLSAVSVKNHQHALQNPLAQFQKEFSLDQVSRSPLIAAPLRLLDCSPISDGAAAVVLTTKKKKGTVIRGFGQGSDTLDLASRSSFTSLPATKKAVQLACSVAQMEIAAIPVAEVHDCFTLAELLALEDLGFFAPGEAGAATLAGQTTYGGQVVVNPSGGLKACGHPVGATGIKQVAYLARLLRDKKFPRAVAHNVGGSGATAVVHVLEQI